MNLMSWRPPRSPFHSSPPQLTFFFSFLFILSTTTSTPLQFPVCTFSEGTLNPATLHHYHHYHCCCYCTDTPQNCQCSQKKRKKRKKLSVLRQLLPAIFPLSLERERERERIRALTVPQTHISLLSFSLSFSCEGIASILPPHSRSLAL